MPTPNVPQPMGKQGVQSSIREKGSVERQIKVLESAMRNMVQSELGTIRTEMQTGMAKPCHRWQDKLRAALNPPEKSQRRITSYVSHQENRTHLASFQTHKLIKSPYPFSHTDYTPTVRPRRDENISQIQYSLRKIQPSQINHSPTERTEEQITHTWNLKRDKAFKQLLSAQVTPYDGSNCMDYHPWKNSLEQEVRDLNLAET